MLMVNKGIYLNWNVSLQLLSYSSSFIMATPKRFDFDNRSKEMKKRLEKCWDTEIDWKLYPEYIERVFCTIVLFSTFLHCICNSSM